MEKFKEKIKLRFEQGEYEAVYSLLDRSSYTNQDEELLELKKRSFEFLLAQYVEYIQEAISLNDKRGALYLKRMFRDRYGENPQIESLEIPGVDEKSLQSDSSDDEDSSVWTALWMLVLIIVAMSLLGFGISRCTDSQKTAEPVSKTSDSNVNQAYSNNTYEYTSSGDSEEYNTDAQEEENSPSDAEIFDDRYSTNQTETIIKTSTPDSPDVMSVVPDEYGCNKLWVCTESGKRINFSEIMNESGLYCESVKYAKLTSDGSKILLIASRGGAHGGYNLYLVNLPSFSGKTLCEYAGEYSIVDGVITMLKSPESVHFDLDGNSL